MPPNTIKHKHWQSSQFAEQDNDPLASFANIMDVMLVFALGLMLALIAQSQDLKNHFAIKSTAEITQEIKTGDELIDIPETINKAINGHMNGMQSLGQVYKDPQTGKLILINQTAEPAQ